MTEFLIAALLALAPIAKGEAPPALVGEEGYTLALCTMRHRLLAGATVSQVQSAYYAPAKRLTERHRAIAVSVANGETECPPVRYLLSEQDRARLGWPPSPHQGKRRVLASGTVMTVHAYERWGGE